MTMQKPRTGPRPAAQDRARILVLIDYYLPGFKFGGPIRTLSNLINRLGDLYDFYIFTADRDEGDAERYREVRVGEWNQVGHAKVYYSSNRSWRNISRCVAEVKPDLIYLNSFFARATMRVLIASKLGQLGHTPILLSPRGEFADGALAIKPTRKAMYIRMANATGLLKNVTLQASSEFEKSQIQKHLPWARKRPPEIAPNVSDPASFKYVETSKQPGTMKVLFLSRISRNKNLDGALRMLQGLNGRVEFSICGPVGDRAYYSECENLMWRLPPSVAVRYLGDVPHDRVPEVLAEHHLMFLPSLGENFGHAIAEALAAGRPVLISDRTPWRGLADHEVGAEFPLEEPERFTAYLQSFIDMDEQEFLRRSRLARAYAIEVAADPKQLQQTVNLIDRLTGKGR